MTEMPLLDWTDWVLILVDRSASMETIAGPTLQGLNTLLHQQVGQPKTSVRVVEFGTGDDGQLELNVLFDSSLTYETNAIARQAYRPRGDTPLFVAVLSAISDLEPSVRTQDHALVVIQTDGYENASPKWATLDKVRARVREKQRDGWVFAYLGAELESWQTGENMGVGMFNSLSYSPTREGVIAGFRTTSDSISRWRREQRAPGRKALPGRFYPLQLPAPKGSP
jgi:hypothetical protein